MPETKTSLLRKIMPGVFVLPQNGSKGYGVVHFVQRPNGNLILDPGFISDAYDEIDALGGVKAMLISDRHFAGPATNAIAEHFGAKTYCSQIEFDATKHRKNDVHVDKVLPFTRQTIESDITLIPTPGHTDGQFSALVPLGTKRVLFTSDFVWREKGKWRPGNLSKKKSGKSFESLRELNFDAVISWTSYSADEFVVPIKSVDKTVDEMIAACTKP